MKASEIQIGTSLKLNIANEILTWKVTVISDNQFKIFNKFRTSIFVDIDFININIQN
jgi:hypothetical protein